VSRLCAHIYSVRVKFNFSLASWPELYLVGVYLKHQSQKGYQVYCSVKLIRNKRTIMGFIHASPTPSPSLARAQSVRLLFLNHAKTSIATTTTKRRFGRDLQTQIEAVARSKGRHNQRNNQQNNNENGLVTNRSEDRTLNRTGKVLVDVEITRRRPAEREMGDFVRGEEMMGRSRSEEDKREENEYDFNNDDDDYGTIYGDKSILNNNNNNNNSIIERLAITGDIEELGGWDTRKCVLLTQTPNDSEKWFGKIEVLEQKKRIELKAVALDRDGNLLRWSPGTVISIDIPERCTKFEVQMDWPFSADERVTLRTLAKCEVKQSDNKIETGGAWLAWSGQQKLTHAQMLSSSASTSNSSTSSFVNSNNNNKNENENNKKKNKIAEDNRNEGLVVEAATKDDDDDDDNNSNSNSLAVEVEEKQNNNDSEKDAEAEEFEEFEKKQQILTLAEELGYTPGSHLSSMQPGLKTEIVYSAADTSRGRGVRIGVLEEGELVEIWSEHSTEVGKGMRVGDLYIGVVVRVLERMNALLIDLTGNGPPYALLQKGVEMPIMTWKSKLEWLADNEIIGDDRRRHRRRRSTAFRLNWIKKLGFLKKEYGAEAVKNCTRSQLKELVESSELIKEWERKELEKRQQEQNITRDDYADEDVRNYDTAVDSGDIRTTTKGSRRWDKGEWGDIWDRSGGPSPWRGAGGRSIRDNQKNNENEIDNDDDDENQDDNIDYDDDDEDYDDDDDDDDDDDGLTKTKSAREQVPSVRFERWNLNLQAVKMEIAAIKSVELALESPISKMLDESDDFMANVAGMLDEIEIDEETGEIIEEFIEDGDTEDGAEFLFGAEEVELDDTDNDDDDGVVIAEKVDESDDDDEDVEGDDDDGDDDSKEVNSKNKKFKEIRKKFGITKDEIRGMCATKFEIGQPIVCQVIRLGHSNKGPRVSARPTLPGRNVVLCPDGDGVYVSRKLIGPARSYVKSVGMSVCPPDAALIMRTEAAGVAQEALELDIKRLIDDWNAVKISTKTIIENTEREQEKYLVEKYHRVGRFSLTRPGYDFPRVKPSRLLNSATSEQVLVRDLFGERIAKLYVDTSSAYDAIVDDLARAGASKEIIDRVNLFAGSRSSSLGSNRAEGRDADDGGVNMLFKHLGIDEVAESLDDEVIWLDQNELPGAHLVIQRTEALTAIDVNAGRSAMKNDGADRLEFHSRLNIAAAKVVAKTLRLRDIGGLVMVDFVDMDAESSRREVEIAFESVANRDRAQVTFCPISPLGVMEIARERLQTHGSDGLLAIVADEKGMPIETDHIRSTNVQGRHSLSAAKEIYNRKNYYDRREENGDNSGRRRVSVQRNLQDGKVNSTTPPWINNSSGRGRGRSGGGRGGGSGDYYRSRSAHNSTKNEKQEEEKGQFKSEWLKKKRSFMVKEGKTD
jgi:Ribonuclease G/E